MRKRVLFAASLVAALLLSVPASAGVVMEHTGNFTTSSSNKARAHFYVHMEDGKAKTVRSFTAHNLPYTCEDGTKGDLDIPKLDRMPVQKHKFDGVYRSSNGVDRISGYIFGKNGIPISIGQVKSKFARGDGTRCATKELHWLSAHPEPVD